MMLRKVGFAEIAAAVLQNLRTNTSYSCYDAVARDTPSPFLFVEVVGKRDTSSKTLYKEVFTVQIHAIATPSDARTEIYGMIQAVEESMTERLSMPDGITLVLQTETGVQSLQQDETNEWHAVLSYEIMVSYGLKCKI
ncbi:MAG: DUF5072 family protein [Oscillospiraceae bacterium]|nr:DUF5072 family protein [Oscillospiraceae bacterium]